MWLKESAMINNKTFLAIIPARGGSKRIPGKNLIELNGKPLIQWTIEAANQCDLIDEVVVTSDDQQILDLAKNLQCNFLERPAELAGDLSSTASVINHVINTFLEQGKVFDYLICLQPTSPLRDSIVIKKAIKLLDKEHADAVISVCELDHPFQWCGTLPDDRNMVDFLAGIDVQTRSQDLEKYYRLNGAIYICDVQAFLRGSSVFLKDNIYAYVMDRLASVDIDHYEDLLVAKAFMDYKVNALIESST